MMRTFTAVLAVLVVLALVAPAVAMQMAVELPTPSGGTVIIDMGWTAAPQSVNAYVNGIRGGNASVGTVAVVDASHLKYVAPTVSSNLTAQITVQAVNGGRTYAQINLTILASAPPPVPPTASISASPTSITAGQSSVLMWQTSNAQSVSLNGQSVASSGSQTVTPPSTTTYTLVATGAGGTTQSAATVTVSTPPPPSGCSGGTFTPSIGIGWARTSSGWTFSGTYSGGNCTFRTGVQTDNGTWSGADWTFSTGWIWANGSYSGSLPPPPCPQYGTPNGGSGTYTTATQNGTIWTLIFAGVCPQ